MIAYAMFLSQLKMMLNRNDIIMLLVIELSINDVTVFSTNDVKLKLLVWHACCHIYHRLFVQSEEKSLQNSSVNNCSSINLG